MSIQGPQKVQGTRLPRYRCYYSLTEQLYNVIELTCGRPTILENPSNHNRILVTDAAQEFCKLMEFTGCQDINGQDIYEWDTVIIVDPGEKLLNEKGRVFFDLGCFFIRTLIPDQSNCNTFYVGQMCKSVRTLGYVTDGQAQENDASKGPTI